MSRGAVRRALAAVGGIAARGAVHEGGPRPIARPFADAHPLEDGPVRAVPVTPGPVPDDIGFLAGVQQWAVEGHLRLTPLVHARVAGAVMTRVRSELRCAARAEDEFLVVPAGRLGPNERQALAATGMPVVECDGGARPHPLVDRWAAAHLIEARRTACERRASREFLATRPTATLLLEGPIARLEAGPERARLVAVVRRHETQFLQGDDLAVVLTLPALHRSSVLAHGGGPDGGEETYSWYLRLWSWADEELLHGLVRVECARRPTPADADRLSGWLLAERSPLAPTEPGGDRPLYPMHEVGAYLRAQAGGWR